MLPDVQVPDYQSAYNSLGSVYDPQTTLVNQQIAQLDPQQEAQQSALDQAKVNAFRDIDTSANRKGILFSGFSPQEQATYVGTKYLPAVADLKANFANQKFSLLDKINQINLARSNQAQGIVGDAQKAASDAAYKNAELALKAQSGGGSAAAQQSDLAGAFNFLHSRKGADNKVSQETWNTAYNMWLNAGYNGADFAKNFQSFINPKYGGYQGVTNQGGGTYKVNS